MINNFFSKDSFRDPGGRLINFDGRIFRLVNEFAKADMKAFLASPTASKFIADGHIVRSDIYDDEAMAPFIKILGSNKTYKIDQNISMVFEHERVPFVTYPFEWSPEMLHAAGSLTLDLADAFLKEGIGLKDATPYNILFRGPKPIFVDVLSFESRMPDDPIWLAYAQFIRTFLLPLLVNKQFNIPLDQIFITRRDGLEPESVYCLAGLFHKIRPPFLSLVSIPVWLSKMLNRDDNTIYQKKAIGNTQKSQFILKVLFKKLRRLLNNLAPREGRRSNWSDYMNVNNNYSDEHFQAKCLFIEQIIRDTSPSNVLDVGCNTGYFSVIAAKAGASVVAIDLDPVVVGEVYKNALFEKLDILPIVVDLTRPTPPLGWCNHETQSFLKRASGSFDAVLMLAVIHHMLVTERIPMSDIIALAACLTKKYLVIEFIASDDTMFKRLTRGRDYLHSNLTRETFETEVGTTFEIVRSQHLENTSRWLYLMLKKDKIACSNI